MKKKVLRLLLATMTVICLTVPMAFVSLASEEKTPELTVTQTTDKTEYSAKDEITVTLSIENEYESLYFTDLKLKNETPEGYLLKDGSKDEKTIDELKYGDETVTLETTFVKKPTPTPKTGDSNNVLLIIGILIVSAAVIIFLVCSKKIRKIFLPVILGFALLGGLLATTSVKTLGAEQQGKIKKSKEVKVDNENVKFDSCVYFDELAKGDIILLDEDTKRYRVIKVEGSQAEVLLQDNYEYVNWYDGSWGSLAYQVFSDGNSYLKYKDSKIDKALNETFYESLSKNIQDAIVDQDITQYAYLWKTSSDGDVGPYDYKCSSSSGSALPGGWTYVTCKQAATVLVGTRHVYTLDLKDIFDYYEKTEINDVELGKLFGISAGGSRWLRAVLTNSCDLAWVSNGGGYGLTNTEGFRTAQVSLAFTIDLSKCDWKQNETKIVLDKSHGATGADGSAKVRMRGTSAADIIAPTREGYTVEGFYSNPGLNEKVLNADGTFADDFVSGYIVNGKWINEGANLTLYTKWLP